jgi:hypothetical protein
MRQVIALVFLFSACGCEHPAPGSIADAISGTGGLRVEARCGKSDFFLGEPVTIVIEFHNDTRDRVALVMKPPPSADGALCFRKRVLDGGQSLLLSGLDLPAGIVLIPPRGSVEFAIGAAVFREGKYAVDVEYKNTRACDLAGTHAWTGSIRSNEVVISVVDRPLSADEESLVRQRCAGEVLRLRGPDDEAQGRARSYLLMMGERALPAVLNALKDTDESARVNAADVLAHMAEKELAEESHRPRVTIFLPQLLDAFPDEPSWRVRYYLIYAMGSFVDASGTQRDQLLAVLDAARKDPGEQVRFLAVLTLMVTDRARGVSAGIDMLEREARGTSMLNSVHRRLCELTGEKMASDDVVGWRKWWAAHREEFAH